ncbi:sulfurtransferase TusA family protein [Desulfovirgula thermocuniculi]|uniref:sulfurtransferase TusA family protein n=1 Tax=Desulfovirgula thermocuniculi TaxID=348842 RepID=UPI00041FA48C|nr:sulfurtransferase TusA family protein [Desulfovirgula thermocuniculi]
MEKEIDARGLLCPEPLLLAKNEMDQMPQGGTIKVLVSTQAARENITRLAESRGWAVEVCSEGEDIVIVLKK